MVHDGASMATSAVAEESVGEEGMDAREREGARGECVAPSRGIRASRQRGGGGLGRAGIDTPLPTGRG